MSTVQVVCKKCHGTGLLTSDPDDLGWFDYNSHDYMRLRGTVGQMVDGKFVPDPPPEHPVWRAYVCRACKGTGCYDLQVDLFTERKRPTAAFEYPYTIRIFTTMSDLEADKDAITYEEFLHARYAKP